MSDLLQVSDLEKAKKHDTFHSEVITGKVGGVAGGADIDYATNAATSQVQKTLPKILDDIDWSYVGLFADGVTFTKRTDFALDSVGIQWVYVGNYPFTATAGTVPSEPLYQAIHVGDHSLLSNINASGGHDSIYDRSFSSVSEMLSYAGHAIGLNYSTGHTKWSVTDNTNGLALGGGLYAVPNNAVAVNDFGGHDDGVTVCTQAIKDAVDAAYKTVSHVVFVRKGTGEFLSDPISFEGYSGLVIEGLAALIDLNLLYLWGDENLPTRYVRIKFISTGDVGFQFASTDNPRNNAWQAGGCQLRNLWLFGNDKVLTCTNGNYGYTLSRIFATHAINDGVTLEDFTYPALIENSQLGPNGRHGLYVRGPMTTVYTLRRVNASNNKGYGYCIEGGSGINVDDCLAQSNVLGGLKITRRNELYENEDYYFLDNLEFNRFYSEHNGLLEPSDPNYEGNYALVVDSVGNISQTGILEAREVRFTGGALNSPDSIGNCYNIDAVYGCAFDGTDLNHSKGILGVNVSSVTESPKPTFAFSEAPSRILSGYRATSGGCEFEVSRGGAWSRRGNINTVEFMTTLTAGVSTPMKLASNVGSEPSSIQAIPVRSGSVYGVRVFIDRSKYSEPTNAGQIIASVTRERFVDEGAGLTFYPPLQDFGTLDITAGGKFLEVIFPALQYPLENEYVSLRLRASAGYSNINFPIVRAQLLIES